jgi:type I restriction enzyme S subunit
MLKNIPSNRYSSYKDSGVEWLGEIPSSWSLTRLGTRFEERKTKVSDKDFPPLSVTKNGTIPQLDSAAKSNDGDNRKLVKTGDFVINSRSDRKGSSGIAYQDGSVSLIYIVIEPKGINPNYCNYLLKSYNFIEEFYRMGHGIVADLWTTRYDEMKAIMVGIPSYEEQTAIANFLDRKTALIDQAVDIKQKQIELLKERRQILIHQAVTRGLNAGAKLKDSGVEWIGQIPEGWEVKKLKYCIEKKIDNRGRTPAFGSKGVPMLEVNNITDGDGSPSLEFNKFVLPEILIKYERDKVKIGDLLISTVGATSGKVVIIKEVPSYFICQNVVGLRMNDLLLPKFACYAIGSLYFKTSLMLINKGNTIDNLKVSVFVNNLIFKPPVNEQKLIAEFIEMAESKIATAISLKEQEIEKLKEYKATLINSAVTGKIKISNYDK